MSRSDERRSPCAQRRRLVVGAAAAGSTLVAPTWAHAELERDEGVVVMPSTARQRDAGHVELRIRAWVYERDGRRLASGALARALGLDLDELDHAQRNVFEARTQLFAREAQGRRRLQWRASAASPWERLPPSASDGSVDAVVVVPRAAATAQAVAPGRGSGSTIGFELGAGSGSGARRFAARAHAIGNQGLSVVSDIDDTIKHTQVRDHRQMLLNTFARPFTAVAGMGEWYADLARAQDAAFHYVSSGPWMMAPAIEAFLNEQAFAPGSLHMRAFSLRPQALLDKRASSRHKHMTIERLLADWPQRRFLLVGDSGEQDPEIYGAITRRHPAQIAAVLIRDVTGDLPESVRYREAFADISRDRWALFVDPAGLPRRWT